MAGTPQGGSGKWLRIGLIVSLALNLLIVGAIAGAALSGGKWYHRGPPRMAAMGGPLTHALAPADRIAMARDLHAAHMDGARPHDVPRKEFEALIADLTATPFDPAAVKTRLATIQGRFEERMRLGQSALVARLAGMDAAGRAAYAERLAVELRRRR